ETGGPHAAAPGDTGGVEARGKRKAFARRLTHYSTAPRRLIDGAWASAFAPRGVPPSSATPSPDPVTPESWSHIVVQRRTDTCSVTDSIPAHYEPRVFPADGELRGTCE